MAQDLYAEAAALGRAGRFAEGLEVLRRRLVAAAPDPATLALLAAFQVELGKPEAALAACEAALHLDPGYAPAHSNRGDALRKLRRPDEALGAYDRALALKPDHLPALVNRGLQMLDLDRPQEALSTYDRALAIDPNLPQAQYGRGYALTELQAYAEALESLERALALRPHHLNALVQKAMVLSRLQRHADARAAYEQAVQRPPRDAGEAIGLGNALQALGRDEEAVAAFDRAAELSRGAPEAIYQRGLARLALCDFEAGWQDYAARWRTPAFLSRGRPAGAPDPLKLSPTREDIAGKDVLVVGEQGIGDQVMFASMLPDLLRAASRVTCVCDRRLAKLFAASFPDATFLDAGLAAGRRFETAVAMGGLGGLFRNRLADFPGTAYLQPTPEAVEAWGRKLGPRRGRLRIGLSWRGGAARTGRAGRSIPLAQLRPLLQAADCEFVSLQYGDVAAEVAEQGQGLRAFPPEATEDFDDLAGLIANLDLVISVQTAAVHLSGALGKACWVLVPVRPEWRYTAKLPSMPWYGSVRILRQAEAGDWDPVVGEAAVGLRARLEAEDPRLES